MECVCVCLISLLKKGGGYPVSATGYICKLNVYVVSRRCDETRIDHRKKLKSNMITMERNTEVVFYKRKKWSVC